MNSLDFWLERLKHLEAVKKGIEKSIEETKRQIESEKRD